MITFILIILISFNINYKNINIKNRLNNTFDALSNTLPDTWVRLVKSADDMIPLYKKSIVESSVKTYFTNNLKNYVYKYELIIYYYDLKDKKEYIGEYTPGVSITITLKEYNYSKTLNFEIGGNII